MHPSRHWRLGWPGWIVGLGLVGQALAIAAIHPFELTYFNILAGGPLGGRHVLSDSNLDWGQGLKGLSRLQRAEPEFRDLTLYYFGDTDPSWYGVEGVAHVVNAVDDQGALPGLRTVSTRYLAVSASLQWGPWGPAGFFESLNPVRPIRMSEDTTIAIYRRDDLPTSMGAAQSGLPFNTGRGPARADLPDRRPARRSSG